MLQRRQEKQPYNYGNTPESEKEEDKYASDYKQAWNRSLFRAT
jgi:hypothetical protein